ncbi:universal stress protein [Natronomonas salina]|uniref:universal stress protein n=1 Tax=Natronomonas salina TaxID=1710540 RepID=UPI0015B4C291|nr:universal stress protein [Natronomonas salina]QLD89591.1 universal stress protein [Natronomonas salina]
MYRTVLVAVDGSEASSDVLAHGIAIASGRDASVEILTVVEPSGNPLGFGVEDVTEIDEAIADLVDTVIGVGDVGDVTTNVEIRRGRPAYELILEYADEVEADVIVAGRHGTSTLPESVLGSTADRVSRLATIPVVIVPAANE